MDGFPMGMVLWMGCGYDLVCRSIVGGRLTPQIMIASLYYSKVDPTNWAAIKVA